MKQTTHTPSIKHLVALLLLLPLTLKARRRASSFSESSSAMDIQDGQSCVGDQCDLVVYKDKVRIENRDAGETDTEESEYTASVSEGEDILDEDLIFVEDDQSEADYIHKGCSVDKPIRCPDNKCYESYASCEVLEGCTDPRQYIMCPSGKCVSDFDQCIVKDYGCLSRVLEKCGDGLCRESCDGIATNGCPMETPVYCQNGTCVQFSEQCFDSNCTLEKPILCSDNTCAESFSDCPENVFSSLIETKQQTEVININSSRLVEWLVYSKADSNNVRVKLTVPQFGLFYPPYSAGETIMEQRGVTSYEGELKVTGVPRSDFIDTRLRYLDLNFQAEKFTNRVFNTRLGKLEPFQFIRSFVFQVKFHDYAYNNRLFRKPVSAVIDFNKIKGYPAFEGADIASQNDQEEDLEATDSPYNSQTPEDYYCLGFLNPATNLWQCVNRSIVDINNETISYQIPSPGIYSILFFPRLFESELGRCGTFCLHKPLIIRALCFYLPVFLIWVVYFYYLLRRVFKNVLDLFKNSEKLARLRFKRRKLDAKKRKQADARNKEVSPPRPAKYSVLENAKRVEKDKEVVKTLLNEMNYDIKSDFQVFMNPLVYSKRGDETTNQRIRELEGKCLNLRYKREQLTKSKIWKINKHVVLKEKIFEFRTAINGLRSIEGKPKVYLMEQDEGRRQSSKFSQQSDRSLDSLISTSNLYGSDRSIRVMGGRSRRQMISKKDLSDDEDVSYGESFD